ncbi:T9SS type A sorting domain-containing protein [Aquimarina algiphila]|uniref:T9SS type A sorting domain-containing protein n=1 Tax=Aquimarina algiphila TaxID=2047982 RepID=UPI00232D7CC9|nr:T9SS type A sorting domain-containing protein [Aquimarina algiphila]
MKKPLHFKGAVRVAFIFFCIQSFSQVPFTPVQNNTMTINGELKTIGNAIVGLNQVLDGVIYTPSDNYNGNTSNNQKIFDYIDVDNDQSTFSSSSAVFTSSGSCAKITYAGLYWAATYFVDRDATNNDNIQYADLPFPDNSPDFRTLKFKPPGVTDYFDIPSSDTQVIFDGYRNTPTNPENSAVIDIPYVCYADVTNIVKDLPTPDGTYTVANMRASTGFSGNNTNGISGGWVLVITYEDNSLSKKYISSQHGYINNQPCSIADPDCLKSFTYSGFQTAPAPTPVRARYAVATLEGDKPFAGDIFQIERPDLVRQDIFTAPANPNGNFFDSSISVDGSYVTNRTPSSENTLGFDLDIFDIPNPNNTVIGNNQTSSTFFTSSAGDGYSIFFNSIQVEVMETDLLVTKRVLDANGIDITGEPVNFADQLFYELTIENKGNEDITGTTIRDVLPDNVDFILGSIVTSDPDTVVTPNSANREINIAVADNLLVQNGGVHTVRFGVQVAPTCADLRDTCSNQINNISIYSYTGISSGITYTGENVVLERDSCGFDVIVPSNTLINEGVCFTESQSVFICAGSVELTADNGFTNYAWTYADDPTVVFPNSQTITVTLQGTYTVLSTGAPGCQDTQQTFVVDGFTTVTNPVVDTVNNLGSNPNVYGNVRTCPITGESLPEIFLCGSGTTLNIPINFPAGTTVVWERLDPAACSSVVRDPDCPTPIIDFGACEGDWVQVSTDIGSYTAEQAGEYRIRATFDSGCMLPFYFNVFQNNFDIDLVVVQEIACGNPGIIRVQNSSNQYEYQLVPGSGVALPYQVSPEFTGLTEAGTYTVNTRQIGGLPTSCVFQASIVLEKTDELTVDINVTQPTNPQGFGEIIIHTLGGVASYSYSINNASPVSTNVFTNLVSGNYSITVEDSNGCKFEGSVVIDSVPEELSVVLNLENTNITCFSEATAAINSEVSGGSGVYNYTLTGTSFLGSSVTVGPKEDGLFNNLFAGTYLYKVESSGSTPVYIPFIVSQPSELVADASVNPVSCNGDQNGTITVNVTGGTSPYFFSLYTGSGDALYTFIEDNMDGILGEHSFATLSAGAYRVEVEDNNGCPVTISDLIISEPSPLVLDIVTEPLTTNSDAQITVAASGGNATYIYELLDAFTSVVVIPAQTSNIFTLSTSGNFIVKVQDINGCEVTQEVTIEAIEEVPLLEYADEILFCAITGRSYPVISIEDQNGEALEVSFNEGASIVWQKLDDISCAITLENDCPTTDSSCSSGWFDINTGGKFNVKEEGEYRIVITFANRTTNNTEIYYFKAENNLPNIADSFMMYPNPSEDIVNVNADVKNIRVFDVMGKLVLETTQNSYNISDLRNGIYFAKIETKDNKEVIVRVVKK